MNKLNNSVQLIGRLGADPEIKMLNNNLKVARMRLVTNEHYYNKAGEKVEDAQWHTLVAWGGLADVCEKHLTKGQEIAIEGKLYYRSYTDKNQNRQFITEITVNDLLMTGSRKAG